MQDKNSVSSDQVTEMGGMDDADIIREFILGHGYESNGTGDPRSFVPIESDALAALDRLLERDRQKTEALREKARSEATAAAGCRRDAEFELEAYYNARAQSFREAAEMFAVFEGETA